MDATVRSARPTDKAPLMEFIKRIWGGHDYIPFVWDSWIRERRARMFVVEVDGLAVGMSRVNFLEDGSAWFEGARIHPAYRGMGLASLLGRDAMRAAAKRGASPLRLTTSSRNTFSKKQIGRMGFVEKSRMSFYEPRKGARFARQRGVRLAKRGDTDAVVGMIMSSKEFKASGGVYWEALRAISFDRETIVRRILERSVYLRGDAVAISKVVAEGAEDWRQVCFACGNAKDVGKLIRHLFSLRRGTKKPELVLCAPQGSPLIIVARKAGLARTGSFILYERDPPRG